MNQIVNDLTISSDNLNTIIGTDNVEVFSLDEVKELASIIKELSLNFDQKRITELIKNKLYVLFFGYGIDALDDISEEVDNKCNLLIKSLWHISQTNFLEQIKLLLIDHFSHIGLLESHGEPRSKTAKKKLSRYQIFCGIFEMMHIYFYLLKITSTNKIIFPQKITWSFVNSDNPIEAIVRKYLSDSGQENKIVTDEYGSKIQFEIKEFHVILEKTFDTKLMTEQIKKFYSVEKLLETIQSSDPNSDICVEQIEAYVLYDFLTNISMCDYLRK